MNEDSSGCGKMTKGDMGMTDIPDKTRMADSNLGVPDDAVQDDANIAEKKLLNETLEYFENNSVPFSDAIIQIASQNDFTLIGESHLSECKEMRLSLIKSLGMLKDQGVTHLAVEADFHRQEMLDSLDFTNENIFGQLKKIMPFSWDDNNIKLIIAAKLIGIKVVCIDAENQETNDADYQNRRDETMYSIIKEADPAKMIILIGRGHVKKHLAERAPCQRTGQNEPVKRIGTWLAEDKTKSVSSIRNVISSGNINGLAFSMSYCVKARDLSSSQKERGCYIVPDDGPFAGDQRVTGSDYVAVTIESNDSRL
ncbi:MAG: hypothetical protein WC227_02400 [Patescibacteria group bacterium]|jgi:hypothetical protein